jgi:hypothetical protein
MAEWMRLERHAEDQSGVTEAREREGAINKKLNTLVDKLTYLAAQTEAGLRFKAELAEKLQSADLAWSLVDDVLAMGGRAQ